MSGLISDQLLNNLRVVAYRQLVTPLTVQRNTPAQTDADTKKTWSTVVATDGWLVGKNVTALSGQPGSAVGIDAPYELRLRQGVDIRPGDRVVIDGENYAVIDVNSEVTLSLFLKASLRRVS